VYYRHKKTGTIIKKSVVFVTSRRIDKTDSLHYDNRNDLSLFVLCFFNDIIRNNCFILCQRYFILTD